MDTQNFGGMGTWLIILILFLFMGNWFWGFGWLGNSAAWLLNWQNQNNNTSSLENLINNNTQWQQQLMDQQALANQTTLITQWFCNTNSNIEKAILAGNQNTSAIIAASAANVQKVLDKLCEQETQALRTQLAEARVIANNNAQTTELLSRLQPTPVPSWIVSSPYTSIYPPTTTA